MSPRRDDPADQGDAMGLEFVTMARYACLVHVSETAGQCRICRWMAWGFCTWAGVFTAAFAYAVFIDCTGVALSLLTVACLLAGMAGDMLAGECHDDELQVFLEGTRCD